MSPYGGIKTALGAVKLAAKHIVKVETDIAERDGAIYFATFQCPYCAGVKSERPFCLTAVGAFEALTLWTNKEQWRVREIRCIACGDDACVFELMPMVV